jgi:4a-hydroxytetrahydrobiopterin dehydratase
MCSGLSEGLDEEEARECLEQFQLQWEIVNNGEKLRREFEFDSFAEAMVFVNDVAAVSEETGHHPRLWIDITKVIVEVTTKDVMKVTEADFRLAAQIDLVE